MPHRLSDPVAIDISKQYGDFRDQLFKDGYAVVKNAVPEEKCKEYIERMTQWLVSSSTLSKFRRLTLLFHT